MSCGSGLPCPSPVALLAEGVGRNAKYQKDFLAAVLSPSSRRAWVEILSVVLSCIDASVALLAEGVGRNRLTMQNLARILKSPSSRRAWVEIAHR
mgnify:CR=1 FL=1